MTQGKTVDTEQVKASKLRDCTEQGIKVGNRVTYNSTGENGKLINYYVSS